MTHPDAAPPVPGSARQPRPIGAAAVAALGVYLVLTLGQLGQLALYAITSYATDIRYLGMILGGSAVAILLAAVPFALAVWLGLGVVAPIRAQHPTRAVVARALIATVVGLVGVAVVALVVAVVTTAGSYVSAGYRSFTLDDLAGLVPRLIASTGSTTTGMIVPGGLAVVLAAVLLRDRLRRRPVTVAP
jgi:hypothetical protein